MTPTKTTALCLLLAASAAAAAAPAQDADDANSAELKVYLPRTQQVSARPLTLGQVCIVFGKSSDRTAAAEKVALGRAPFSREQMRVDRAMILGRLAASGFSARDIRFAGSQEVAVSLNEQEVDASRLVAAAAALLNTKNPPVGEAQWRLAGEVEPLALPSGAAVKLAPTVTAATADQAVVRVDVVRGGNVETSRQLKFNKAYLWRQAVARADIAAGETLTEQNAAVEELYRPRPQSDWQSPFGKLAARAISAGAVIAPDLLTTPKPALVFERNAAVRIRVDLGGFTLMAKGVALAAGRVGQTVPVQNIDSKRIVTARVCADGSVEPLLEENKK